MNATSIERVVSTAFFDALRRGEHDETFAMRDAARLILEALRDNGYEVVEPAKPDGDIDRDGQQYFGEWRVDHTGFGDEPRLYCGSEPRTPASVRNYALEALAAARAAEEAA